MKVLVIILLFSTNVFGQYSECTDPNGIDWLNLPLFRGEGYGEITDSTATFTISEVTFTNDRSDFPGAGGGGFGNGSGLLIDGSSNITIEYCVFKDIYNLGVYLNDCSDITIRYCVFVNCSWGIMAESCDNNIKIYGNVIMEMYGQKVTLSQGPYRGQAVYFYGTSGTGHEVYNNVIINHTGENFSEDIINIGGNSSGTALSNILVYGNTIWQGGPGTNGVGIIAGDLGGDYIHVYSNKVAYPGIFGFSVAGGDFHNFHDNMVYSDRTIWSGGPYAVYENTAPCSNITFDNNAAWVWGKHNVFNDNCYACVGTPCSSSSLETPTNLGSSSSDQAGAYTAFTSGMCANLPNCLVEVLICPDVMWQLRSTKYRSADIVAHGNRTGNGGDAPNAIDLTRPTANAGTDQGSVTISTVSLDGTATVSTQPTGLTGAGVNTIASVEWDVVSGPNNPTIVSPTVIDTDVTGLITGTYIFRVVVTQNLTWNNAVLTTGQADISYYSSHADWVQVTVNITASGIKMPVKFAAIKDPVNYKHNWASR